MKVVLLNPPNKNRIQRRYMCSYNAPNMLLPPQELIALGGILRGDERFTTQLVDAIAEGLSSDDLREKLKAYNPDVIVSIQGFECFEEDMEELALLKKAFPQTLQVLFGHYATLFPEEILKKTSVDVVIMGEPDLIFGQLMESLMESGDYSSVAGIAYKDDTGVVMRNSDTRINHPEELPMPAYELLKADKYFEPFMKAPFGLIQSARGCPYTCNYCVRSFGKKLTYRTPDQIVEEILFLQEKFGIRSLRFIDDTFTANPKRVIEVCKRIIDLGIQIEWNCLSRLDTIKGEMIPWMKKAGCKRIYFGVESGSPKVLKYLNKNLDLDVAAKVVKECGEAGIETLGFFMVGAPPEDEEAFRESVDFAVKADFDYVTVSELVLYPGTELFDQLKDEVEFSLFPYKNEWYGAERREIVRKREKEFYRRFYFRGGYVGKTFRKFISHPTEYIGNVFKLSSYLIKPAKEKRADYF